MRILLQCKEQFHFVKGLSLTVLVLVCSLPRGTASEIDITVSSTSSFNMGHLKKWRCTIGAKRFHYVSMKASRTSSQTGLSLLSVPSVSAARKCCSRRKGHHCCQTTKVSAVPVEVDCCEDWCRRNNSCKQGMVPFAQCTSSS